MFEKQRLDVRNIGQYIHSVGGIERIIPNILALRQDDYGTTNDCTLVSLTAIIKYKRLGQDIRKVYQTIVDIARKNLYTSGYGTPNLTVKRIMQQAFAAYNIPGTVHSCYLKNVGFNYSLIKKNIDAGRPMILNLLKDGRNYYYNHSVLIVGYYETKTDQLLVVYDNWDNTKSYIDYSLLSTISSIFYLQ